MVQSERGREERKYALFLIDLFAPPFNLIFTRPGFAQSFGCSLLGSNSVSNLNLAHAFTISLAMGFSTASSSPTRRPSALLLFTSKYTGYMHWKSLYLDSSCVVWNGWPWPGGCEEEEVLVVEGMEEGFMIDWEAEAGARCLRISRSSKSSETSLMSPSEGSLSDTSSIRACDIVAGVV